jgi:hypothetical protein
MKRITCSFLQFGYLDSGICSLIKRKNIPQIKLPTRKGKEVQIKVAK